MRNKPVLFQPPPRPRAQRVKDASSGDTRGRHPGAAAVNTGAPSGLLNGWGKSREARVLTLGNHRPTHKAALPPHPFPAPFLASSPTALPSRSPS
ncbi:hypothetical protein E2C01_065196 [Portunus trituberculatus]|uniref:Uncharacterized protein n=1 Tax=Portunus trituberculatus TaxID=210409 RepID=A0A5B7HDU8_PORTR|nr:hypothetical protein [Portunus trituberculatus]